jgi:mono/diheme cytochrome c family protein
MLPFAGLVLWAQPQKNEVASAPPLPSGLTPAEIFKGNCARCHGPDGSGQTFIGRRYKIPDLRSAEVQKLTDKELIEIVTKGKNLMPTWEKKLAKQDIAKAVSAVRSFALISTVK